MLLASFICISHVLLCQCDHLAGLFKSLGEGVDRHTEGENITMTSQEEEEGDEEGTTQNDNEKEGKPAKNGSITTTEVPTVTEEHPVDGNILHNRPKVYQ